LGQELKTEMNIYAHKRPLNAFSGQASVCAVGQAASAYLFSDFAVLRLLP